MNKFTNFYLCEDQDIAVPLTIDFKNDVHTEKELNGFEYESIKDYLVNATDPSGKNVIPVQDINKKPKAFSVLKRYRSDEEHSSMSNTKYLNHPVQKILELMRFGTSSGIIFMYNVQGGSTKYHYIASDKTFTKNMNVSISEIVKAIKIAIEEQKNKKAEDEAKALEAEVEKKKQKGRESYLKGKPKRQATIAQKKAEAEKSKAEQEEIKKLGSRSPMNGRFGYFDIDFDEYKTIIQTLEKDPNTLTDKKGYEWTTDSRTSEGNKFGEGKFFKIKGADKKKPESIVYLFYYYDKYLPNTGMIIFDGTQAFDDFVEVQLATKAFPPNGKFGRDAKVRLKNYDQATWVNENPKNIAPPLHADTVEDINKTQNPPKKKLKKESTWYDRVILEIQ